MQAMRPDEPGQEQGMRRFRSNSARVGRWAYRTMYDGRVKSHTGGLHSRYRAAMCAVGDGVGSR